MIVEENVTQHSDQELKMHFSTIWIIVCMFVYQLKKQKNEYRDYGQNQNHAGDDTDCLSR
jgi:hypothetical protein